MQEGAAIERARLAELRDRLWAGLEEAVGGVHLNGSREHRIEGNLNVRIDQVDADSLLLAMPDVAISTGSACSSGALTLRWRGMRRSICRVKVRVSRLSGRLDIAGLPCLRHQKSELLRQV